MSAIPLSSCAYLAIFLHFARKILAKVSTKPVSAQKDFIFFCNEDHQVDITLTEYVGKSRQATSTMTYTGILQIKAMSSNDADHTRETLRANLERLNAGEWRNALGMHTDYIADAHFRIRMSELPYGKMGCDYVIFKAKYGLATYSRIRNALFADTKLLYLGHAKK